MKNQPTSIFLDLGWKINPDHDFNDFSHITWSVDNATGNGLEYVSLDEMSLFVQWASENGIYYRKNVGYALSNFTSWLTFEEVYQQFKNR